MKIVHLVDDNKPGGVLVMVNRLKSLAFQDSTHSITFVKRGSFLAQKIDADLIISHLAMSWRNLPFLISLRNRHASVKLIHIEHTYCTGFEIHNVKHTKRFRNMLRISYSLFNSIIAVSNAQSEWMENASLVAPDRLIVVPNCVDLKKFEQVAQSPKKTDKISIAAIGRFHRQKGFDLLIQGFLATKNPNLELKLVGYGPDEKSLKKLAEKDSRIIFEAFSETPQDIYKEATFVAVPSRWEAFGLVAQEARAAGCVVLSSGIDGLKEQSVSTELVAEATSEGWTALLEKLPNMQRTQLIKRGRQQTVLEEIRFLMRWAELFKDDRASSFQKKRLRNVLSLVG